LYITSIIFRTLISDPKRIRQLIFTLVYNSLKYTTEGQIILKVKMKNEGMLKIVLIDTGCGMD
jgi:signal transduction histidine kinase